MGCVVRSVGGGRGASGVVRHCSCGQSRGCCVVFFLMHFVRHPARQRHCVKMDFISSQVMYFSRSTWILKPIEYIAIENIKHTMLCAISAAQATSLAHIDRHNGHDGINATDLIEFFYPTINSTSSQISVPSWPPTLNLTSTTDTATASSTSSLMSYSNATSTTWLQYGSGIPGPSPSSTHHAISRSSSHAPGTTPWDDLWSLHWPASSTLDSSSTTIPAPPVTDNSNTAYSYVTATPPIPTLTARPSHPANRSSTATVIIPITNMSAPSNAKPSIPTSEQYAALDPIIFDPGRLPQSSAALPTGRTTVRLAGRSYATAG